MKIERCFFLVLACVAALLPLGAHAEDIIVDPKTRRFWNSLNEPESDDQKSYILPAFEILGFQFLLNQYNRNFASDKEDYRSDWDSIHDNVHHSWRFDRDSFTINQLGHPYQGSIYFGLARSSGLNFWESLGYTTAGSAIWEIAGEKTPPSLNDQITTSVGGTYLGEALFRIAQEFWRDGHSDDSGAGELGAAVASPPAEVNRLAFGTDLKPDLQKKTPPLLASFSLGYLNNNHISDALGMESVSRDLAAGRFQASYGMPGKSGYKYDRPFDYLNLDLELSSSDNGPVDDLSVRGMIVGASYAPNEQVRGIYGIYGNYDYIAPEVFRVASTAITAGSTAQVRLNNVLTLQGSLLGGCGFGAGGSVNETEAGNDYHYGAIPEGIAALRILMRDRIMIDLSGREFYITGKSSTAGESDSENIFRLQAALTARVYGPNALSLQYAHSERNADFSAGDDQHQKVDTIGVLYTYLWGRDLGVVSY